MSAREKLRLGRAIAAARDRIGLSQEELGARIGRDQRYVSRLENGLARWPEAPLLRAIAAEVGTRPEDLLRAAGYLTSEEAAAEAPPAPARVFAMAAERLQDLPAEDREAALAAFQFALALYRRRHGRSS